MKKYYYIIIGFSIDKGTIVGTRNSYYVTGGLPFLQIDKVKQWHKHIILREYQKAKDIDITLLNFIRISKKSYKYNHHKYENI